MLNPPIEELHVDLHRGVVLDAAMKPRDARFTAAVSLSMDVASFVLCSDTTHHVFSVNPALEIEISPKQRQWATRR